MLHGMGLIQLYSTPKTSAPANDPSQTTSRCHENSENPSFCRCQKIDVQRKPVEKPKPKCQLNLTGANQLPDTRKVYLDAPKGIDKSNLQIPPDTCRCGEDTCTNIDWTWDRLKLQPQTTIQNHTVQFHPIYSQGTSVVRSSQPLLPNMIHYWEIKIVHWLSGTDLMVGIGTDAFNLMEYRYKFASALGLDHRSWGYSHRGMIQHKNILKYYGKSYTKRCIVGVYLDLSRGHLEFYVNRIPQGIAFRNIPLDKELYAMVCSTSAKSSVRLINTTSFRDCLQFRCMKVITKYPQLLDKVQNIPGLANLCRDVWFMFPKERYQYSEESNDNQQENNMGAQMSTESTLNGAEETMDDCGDQSMEVLDDCDSLPNSFDSSNEHEGIDEAIFLSTFKDEPQQSSDDDDPVYDDGD